MKKPASNNSVAMTGKPGEAPSRTVARHLLDPATTAAGTIGRIHQGLSADSDINGYIAELQAQAQLASAGNLGRSEAMLTAQAATLDALFYKLTNWAMNHATREDGNPSYVDTCMRLALKAQSQCRATNETLAAIKNPPVVYARQANFAANQQVNNGGEPPRVREIENPPTKLLEAQHGERLDTGAATPAIGANQTMEAVGAVNGAANVGR